MRIQQWIRTGLLSISLFSMFAPRVWSQSPTPVVEQPDAERTKEALSQLLEHYPPSLRGVLAQDASLLTNQPYLAPYPALAAFLSSHPEVIRNPSFYITNHEVRPHNEQVLDLWREMLNGLSVFVGFGMAIGVVVWLIRTLVDYRRWNRLTKIQTEVHTKLLDRFTTNEDLLAYMQSPSGAKFLESSPINLDARPRSVAAPLGRILWSVQAGLVMVAAGFGLQVVSNRVVTEASQPLSALGVLGIAIGVGFVVSAVISFLISRRLGLIEPTANSPLTTN